MTHIYTFIHKYTPLNMSPVLPKVVVVMALVVVVVVMVVVVAVSRSSQQSAWRVEAVRPAV